MDVGSLLASIRERLEPRLNKQGVQFVWRVNDIPELGVLDPDAALQVLRIVQEAITNVLKHAGASKIEIATSSTPTHAIIAISDDGIGLPATESQWTNDNSDGHHLGLGNMQARASQLGGEIAFGRGIAGSGATVQLLLPLPPANTPSHINT